MGGHFRFRAILYSGKYSIYAPLVFAERDLKSACSFADIKLMHAVQIDFRSFLD
jgi:hypothetical protein